MQLSRRHPRVGKRLRTISLRLGLDGAEVEAADARGRRQVERGAGTVRVGS
jgi:hypothetical protein